MTTASVDDQRIPTSVLSSVVHLADRLGVDAAPWCAGTGLTVEALDHPGTTAPYRQCVEILRRALAALPPGPHGLTVATQDLLLSFGMLGVAMRSAATLGEAAVIGTELHQASGSLVDVALEEGDGVCTLRLTERTHEPDLLPFLAEEVFTSVLLLARTALRADVTPERLELAYPRPAHAAEYARVFGCEVVFGAAATGMTFSTELLGRALPTHDPESLAAAVEICRRTVGAAPTRPPEVVTTVEALVRSSLPEPVAMGQVAARLFITERTLRRRLSAAGTSFGEIHDRVREERATALLRDTDLAVERIAHQVGFGSARDLRRAYLRWTGSTPSAVRAGR